MAQPHISGSRALPSDVTSVMTKSSGKKAMSRMAVTRGRNPLRSSTIPKAMPATPMTSIAKTPATNMTSIHCGVK